MNKTSSMILPESVPFYFGVSSTPNIAKIKLQQGQNYLLKDIHNKNKFLIKNISMGQDPFL